MQVPRQRWNASSHKESHAVDQSFNGAKRGLAPGRGSISPQFDCSSSTHPREALGGGGVVVSQKLASRAGQRLHNAALSIRLSIIPYSISRAGHAEKYFCVKVASSRGARDLTLRYYGEPLETAVEKSDVLGV
jgi:hypothetical protein